MSGIVGIYNLDGRPVDAQLLQRMTAAITKRGPDGAGHWVSGPVALGHLMLHTTPEALRERQPLMDETARLCLTLDGRVDNREELRAALLAQRIRLRDETDAELVLRAYECWGIESPQRIIGDFAYAIWDERERQLFCARDALGARPFYYYADDYAFRCGSELQLLFEEPAIQRAPNEGMIGEYLAAAITSREETLFQQVWRLPPAHALVVKPGQLRKLRYWDIDPARRLRYRTDEEYAEHLRQLLKEVVLSRLRSLGPVGVLLSGGVDSSSVVGIAKSLCSEQRPPSCAGIETYSLIFPGLACDESDYIDEVVRLWGVKSNRRQPDTSDLSCYSALARRYADFPSYPNGVMSFPLLGLAKEQGLRVMLTGAGSDEAFGGSLLGLADSLRQLKLFSLWRQLCWDSKSSIQSSLAMLRSYGLRPFIPRAVLRATGRKPAQNASQVASVINPRFAKRIQLADRLRQPGEEPPFQNLAQADIYRYFTFGWMPHGLELGSRECAWLGIDLRHAFLDRRVFELALALPADQHRRGGLGKFVLRGAMKDYLPEVIRQRRTKAHFTHLTAETLLAAGQRGFFDSLSLEGLGWIDGAQVRTMYQQMVQDYAQANTKYITYVRNLWMIYGVELWFKAVFENHQGLFPSSLSHN